MSAKQLIKIELNKKNPKIYCSICNREYTFIGWQFHLSSNNHIKNNKIFLENQYYMKDYTSYPLHPLWRF